MDFNLLLGNDDGIVLVFNELQTNGAYYNEQLNAQLSAAANSSLAGYKESTAHSQGIYENSAEMRRKIERMIMSSITKIDGVYNFNGKRFFINQVLGRDEALDILKSSAGINGLLTHTNTSEILGTNTGQALIDGLLGGTEAA